MMTRQRGFMLIEVLVAMLLSAVALLALASANAAALRYTKMSQYRAQALTLAVEISERMRANPVVGRVLEKVAGLFLVGFGLKLALTK
jgi:type IV pilus modification protein PilV